MPLLPVSQLTVSIKAMNSGEIYPLDLSLHDPHPDSCRNGRCSIYSGSLMHIWHCLIFCCSLLLGTS